MRCHNPDCRVEFTPTRCTQRYCCGRCRDLQGGREYAESHPEARKMYAEQYRKRDGAREWWRNWYASLSPERKAARQQASRDNYAHNKTYRDAKRRQHYYDNRAAALAKSKERQDRMWNTPEEIARRKTNRNRRRSKERMTDYPLTAQEWRMLLEVWEYKCAYCSLRFPLEQDHVIPISKGGQHTLTNVVPACEICNRKKAAKDVRDFIRSEA